MFLKCELGLTTGQATEHELAQFVRVLLVQGRYSIAPDSGLGSGWISRSTRGGLNFVVRTLKEKLVLKKTRNGIELIFTKPAPHEDGCLCNRCIASSIRIYVTAS